MAKRKRPDPAITEKHVRILRPLARKLERQRRAVAVTEEQIGAAVRAAFKEGVLVGAMKEATRTPGRPKGFSGSRIYQRKHELRDLDDASGAVRLTPREFEVFEVQDVFEVRDLDNA